jgi:hypothetical protein
MLAEILEISSLVVLLTGLIVTLTWYERKQYIPDYDEEGYLTDAGFKRRVRYDPCGGVEIDFNALRQTRQWAKMMKLSGKLHQPRKPLIFQD